MRTKKSVEAFLTGEAKKKWMELMGDKLLELAKATTNEGKQAAKKDGDKEGAGGGAKGQKKGKPKPKGGGGEGAGAGASNLLQIDFDVKMDVLSRSLRARKLAFALKLEQQRAAREAAEAKDYELLEIQRAREIMRGGAAADAQPAPARTWRPPLFRLLETQEQLLPLIGEAMLETASLIHEGKPIDSQVSVNRTLRASNRRELQAASDGQLNDPTA